MKRKEKIQLLKAISEGKASVEDLQPFRTYFFVTDSRKPGIYKLDNKEFNQQEYEEFCKRVRERSAKAFIWNEEKTYKDPVTTIRICYDREDYSKAINQDK